MLKAENYSEKKVGCFGFDSSTAGILSGFCMSVLADTRRFQHSLKFELSVHTYFYGKPILPSTALTIGLSTALIGLFSDAALPLMYEAFAEIMFPLPESLSASILVQWINVASLIFLFITPNRDKLMKLLVLILIAFCILMILFARFSYKRRGEDEGKRLEKEQEQNIGHENINSDIIGILNEPQYGTFS